MTNPTNALQKACRLTNDGSPGAVRETLGLFRILEDGRLRSGPQVRRLHDLACLERAFPRDRKTLLAAEHILENFAARHDLARYRRQLADTGIAGTLLHYPFYWQTAKWLHERWPNALAIDWKDFENQHGLDDLWSLLLSFPATEALEHLSLSAQAWIDALKRPDETDAAFLIRHFIKWRVDESVREKTWDDLDIPLTLSPADGTPSITCSISDVRRVYYRQGGAEAGTPTPIPAIPEPESVYFTDIRSGRGLIDLARVQMITRSRDLFAFVNADARDVRVLSYDRGLQFIGYGLQPHQRCLLETMYVFLILRNGVPIGYTQASVLFRSAEINFNVFDAFRGMETSRIFTTTLAMVRHLFQVDTFIVNTQQLGEGNTEALKSGAFWFYYKQGFRPHDVQARRLASAELARKKAHPGYRSGLNTLKKLARSDLYLFLGRPRTNTVSTFPTGAVGLAAARALEHRANNTAHAVALAAGLLGYRGKTPFSSSQRVAWERWSAIALALPGLDRWSAANKRALIDVINAKGARRESGYVRLFDKHRTLRKALLKLAAQTC